MADGNIVGDPDTGSSRMVFSHKMIKIDEEWTKIDEEWTKIDEEWTKNG